MGKRRLEIMLKSAEFLTRQFPSSAMVVFATAYITNDPAPVQESESDFTRDINPIWNQLFNFTVDCSSSGSHSTETLHISLYNSLAPRSSNFVGSVHIPLIKFLASEGKEATASRPISCEVSTGGRLCLSYKLGAYVNAFDKFFGTLETEAGLIADIALQSGGNN